MVEKFTETVSFDVQIGKQDAEVGFLWFSP